MAIRRGMAERRARHQPAGPPPVSGFQPKPRDS
jgi:hypothetical protein